MMQAMKRRTVLLGVGGLAAMAVSGWAAWRASFSTGREPRGRALD